jgi:hypothetical protein
LLDFVELITFHTASGHEGQFAPPRPSGRSAFGEETFAGRCGNEKDAPIPAILLGPDGSP